MFAAILSAALLAAGSSDNALQPWASKAQPRDVAKSQVEEISQTGHTYTIVHGGNVDGECCRTPMGCGINREGIIDQSWQSNRAVRMENVGQTDLVNPWLSNGRNNFRTIDEIVASAITPGMSDKEKAIALWFQHVGRRFHRGGYGGDLSDPVLVLNCYGHHVCGQDAQIQSLYWQKVGLKSAPVRLVSHAIAQVQYDGGWHVLDGDLESFFLLRDNETLASDCELARDHDLIKRAHTYGLTLPDLRRFDEGYAAMFVCEDTVRGDRAGQSRSTMNMTLRPGEALVWRWGHLTPPKYSWREQPDHPEIICNGLWEYRPDFTGDLWKKGATKIENIVSTPEGLRAEEGKTGTILWTMRSPYNYVGGRFEAEGKGAVLEVSEDGKKWFSTEKDAQGRGVEYHFFSNWGSQRFHYLLRCQLTGDARLKRLAAINDLQMHFMALPEMVVGDNKFTYTDQSPGERKVTITHEWTERTVRRLAAPEAVYPPDGGQAEGTDFAFRWSVPQEAGGEKVVDALFMLSDKPDVKVPLSTNFYKLISRTADKAKPQQYTPPYLGLLTGGKQYYWRVRAKDEKGVWSPWSKTFSFTTKAPNYPLDVALSYDKDNGMGTLKWKANPAGEKPAKYRVYGSDEKGFTVSDVPYTVSVGISKELKPEFLANFIVETAATELPVLGSEVTLPAANKTYYRVVAVDAEGKRSGPSDYATAPRPVIYGKPALTAKVGAEYRGQVSVNRSLGDLRKRAPEVANFWEIEHPKYVKKGPSWLKLDADTGALTGTPDAAGKFEVEVTATIDREVRKLDEGALGWGQEKVLSTSTVRVGSASQRFVIEVSP
ncbi:MAG: putative Ig domain-containing protein [Tepidisphaerales bacterium]